jgi:monofunctional biosynthetic peptidoglycan transglycosylase
MSLENNGGFASVRGSLEAGALEGISKIAIRVRGDGQTYQLRLRTSPAFDGVAYVADLETVRGEWTTVTIAIRSFEPSFRGFRPRNAPPLDPGDVRQIGLMLTDKQDGPFRIDIGWIDAAEE